jgi:hypothetical protein
MEGAYMPFVFGRETNGDHPLDPILKALQDGPIATKAVALNLMRDRRVSQERADAFLEVFDQVRDDPKKAGWSEEKLIQQALSVYREKFLAGREIHDPHRAVAGTDKSDPHFALNKQNRDNLLDNAGQHPRPTAGTLLTNVLDLTGLDKIYLFAEGIKDSDPDWKNVFKNYPTNSDTELLAGWLEGHLKEGPGALGRQLAFVRATFKALNRCREEYGPFQPIWATRWEKFRERTADAGPAAWLEATGLGREDPRRWLIVLVYPVEEVQWLARPTQLDAGWYQYHFPSPPCLGADQGGHPMDLRTEPCPEHLLPEFIHEQFEYDIKHWDDSERPGPNRLVGCTAGPTVDALELQRRNHHRLLITSYPDFVGEIEDWMPRPF